MQKKIILVTAIVLSVIATACHKKAMTQTTGNSPKGNEVKTDAAADMSATGGAYRVDSLSLKGDELSIFVNYSGGCKEHSFELISNGMYSKSLPPQVSLCLKHTNNDDMCKKLVMQELKFNISKIKYPGSKTVVVNIGEKGIHYNY